MPPTLEDVDWSELRTQALEEFNSLLKFSPQDEAEADGYLKFMIARYNRIQATPNLLGTELAEAQNVLGYAFYRAAQFIEERKRELAEQAMQYWESAYELYATYMPNQTRWQVGMHAANMASDFERAGDYAGALKHLRRAYDHSCEGTVSADSDFCALTFGSRLIQALRRKSQLDAAHGVTAELLELSARLVAASQPTCVLNALLEFARTHAELLQERLDEVKGVNLHSPRIDNTKSFRKGTGH